jgi:hypothetical protein
MSILQEETTSDEQDFAKKVMGQQDSLDQKSCNLI